MVRALAAHLFGPDSNFGVEAICGSLLLVFSFAARGFHPGTPVSQFAIFTSPTIHFVCLCYLISPGYYSHTQEKLKFWGESKVYYVRFADGEFMA